MQTLNFTDHRRSLYENLYVYAVVSRRAGGLSIGLNLNPDKRCNFNCPYCQVDRTNMGPIQRVDLRRLEQELNHLFSLINSGSLWDTEPFNTAPMTHRRVSDIAFAGDGEPTSSRAFSDAVEVVARLLESSGIVAPIRLLTNATLFHRKHVQEGLSRFWRRNGQVWAKLDAGTEAYFQVVDGTRFPFQRVLDNLTWASKKAPLTLQCLFHEINGKGPSFEEIDAWIKRIEFLIQDGGDIAEVQVYTVARKPADPSVSPLPRIELDRIAQRLRQAKVPSQLKISVHG